MCFEPGFGVFSLWTILGPLHSEYMAKGNISHWPGKRDSVLAPPAPSSIPQLGPTSQRFHHFLGMPQADY